MLAHYNQLSAGDEDLRGALRRQIITLSRTHRVLGPFTGLLVLETEQDYQRYAIRRDALSDILTIGERGPELLHRDGKQLVLGGARGGTFETDADADTTGRDPDTDGDGLPDRDDRCPDELPTQLARYTGTIRGIYFDRNSAKITPKRKPILDRAVAILREFPTIRLEISGHCAQGEKPELGLARATAVRDYLVDHGIDPARLDVRNAGLDEPVDTNKTAAGRAKHRRIEFSLGPASWAPAPPPPPPSRPSWTREPAAKSVEAPPYS
ncbi:MAG TPA: OmpA family protein, partial [Nannocystis sp.]